ncbi:glucose-6-phosphate isomerase [Candidatus Pelagibacter sp.]|nr:glucose-6-phosphate isomerase [Candidatus Pelagibacter sp.]
MKKYLHYRIIGMGGSILGTEAIYDFLKEKVKKNFYFVNNLQSLKKLPKKNYTNLIVSKSGNTLETISNLNILIKKNQKSFVISENKNNYLTLLAKKLKFEIIHHNNFIGGRYSVLSEVGMLPVELMGLNEKKFKQLNNLVENKRFVKSLVSNVSTTLNFVKKKKFNSVILNYDEKSENLFKWYQQLVAESLGKKGKGIFPIISTMPKDNHSLMQLYLDGPKNNFFTFFFTYEKNSLKINNKEILSSHKYIKNKNLNQIMLSQKKATENVFLKKNIPFRSFEILNRDEKTLGELFCFFILETILLGRALKINPYDQPSVELIKKETKKILI